MRQDMTRLVNQGGNSHKFRPFVGRRVDCTPVLDVVRDFGDSDFGFEREVTLGLEPVDRGRVRMRDKRIGWGDEKDNVTFRPLRRWLAAQVGRRWSEVYSELSGKFIPSMHQSLREWAAGEVSQDCYRNAAGELVFNCAWGGVKDVSWNDYYVDPDTGILCASQRNWGRRRWKDQLADKAAERAQVFRQGKGNLQYHKRNGIWYEVTTGSYSQLLARITAEEAASTFGYSESKYTVDTFTKRLRINLGDWEAQELYGHKDLYSVSHRALSRKDCQRLNLD